MPDRRAKDDRPSVADIRARAAAVARSHEAVDRSFKVRDGSAQHDEAWKEAAEEFHRAIAALYEPFNDLAHLIRRGETDAIELAVRYLEADPWCFRSGYLKEELMTALANVPLSGRTQSRLRDVVMRRLHRREPRLLKPTGRLAANVWDRTLAEQLTGLRRVGTEAEREDADAVIRAVEHKHRSAVGGRGDDLVPPS